MKEGYTYPKNSFLSVLIGCIVPIILWYLAQIIVGFIIGFSYVFINGGTENLLSFISDNAMLVTIFSQICSLLFLVPIYFKHKNYIVKRTREDTKDIVFFIVGGLVIVAIGIISGFLTTILDGIIQTSDGGLEGISSLINSSSFVITFFSTVILAPVVEEILFRGIIFNRIDSKYPTWIAIILSALIFGWIHGNIMQGLNAFILGIVIAYIYSKYRTLWPCMIGHMLNNLLAIVCQTINYYFGASYSADSFLSIVLQVIILIISVVVCLLYFKKRNTAIENKS